MIVLITLHLLCCLFIIICTYIVFYGSSLCYSFVFFSSCYCFIFLCSLLFFFFKQKTAYAMRMSDWSSDVCSSDLRLRRRIVGPVPEFALHAPVIDFGVIERAALEPQVARLGLAHRGEHREGGDIGVALRRDELDLRVQIFLLGVQNVEDRAGAHAVFGANAFQRQPVRAPPLPPSAHTA